MFGAALVARADALAPDFPDKPLTFTSANGRYTVVLTSPSGRGRRRARPSTPARIELFREPSKGAKPIWSVPPPDQLIWTSALVSDDGRYVAVLNERSGDVVAAILGTRGELLASITLDALLANHERSRLTFTASTVMWSARDHQIDGPRNRLTLNAALRGGSGIVPRSIEIALPSGKVLNRSPEVTAPPLELVKRLRTTADLGELFSTVVQLQDAKDAATVDPLIALARDKTAPLDSRRAALEALDTLAGDEQWQKLADVLGEHAELDSMLLLVFGQRKLTAAIPHIERLRRETTDKQLGRDAEATLERLRTPTPPPPAPPPTAEERLRSGGPAEIREGLARLNGEALVQHFEKVVRLCAHHDEPLRLEAERRLLAPLLQSNPDTQLRERLLALASHQPALAAHAPLVLIVLAAHEERDQRPENAEKLLNLARRSVGVARERGAATAAARLARLQSTAGRAEDAEQIARQLEGSLRDLTGCWLAHDPTRVGEGVLTRCNRVSAPELAKLIRFELATVFELKAHLERTAKGTLILKVSAFNASGETLKVRMIRGQNVVVSAEPTPCAPISPRPRMPWIRLAVPFNPPRELAPGESAEVTWPLYACHAPGSRVRVDFDAQVGFSDSAGRSWRKRVSGAAFTENP